MADVVPGVGDVPPGGADLPRRLSVDLDGCFPELVATLGSAAYTTALRTCGRPDDAADLTAEAFLRAYAAMRGYPPGRVAGLRLRPWLLTIVLNLARNWARAAARRPAQVSLDAAAEPADGSEGPADRAVRDDAATRLGALVAGLPDAQRSAVVLRHVVGLPYAEVAEVMGCPEGTAKSHVLRGLSRLRSRLTEEVSP